MKAKIILVTWSKSLQASKRFSTNHLQFKRVPFNPKALVSTGSHTCGPCTPHLWTDGKSEHSDDLEWPFQVTDEPLQVQSVQGDIPTDSSVRSLTWSSPWRGTLCLPASHFPCLMSGLSYASRITLYWWQSSALHQCTEEAGLIANDFIVFIFNWHIKLSIFMRWHVIFQCMYTMWCSNQDKNSYLQTFNIFLWQKKIQNPSSFF